jgi:hypothetical protein
LHVAACNRGEIGERIQERCHIYRETILSSVSWNINTGLDSVYLGYRPVASSFEDQMNFWIAERRRIFEPVA